jgi:quercetin dioxygenase-like cupin family protein
MMAAAQVIRGETRLMEIRKEFITQGDVPFALQPVPGFGVRMFASGPQGSQGLTTCAAVAEPGTRLPYHTHPTGEAITLAAGQAAVFVEGRRYKLGPYDSIHIPAGIAHSLENIGKSPAVMHTAFPTDMPSRTFMEDCFEVVDREATDDSVPEHLMRLATAPRYDLGEDVQTCDLFAGRFGATGMCGGYAVFPPGTGLPCHFHEYDESITIVRGQAVCQVAGAQYTLSDFDTACIPRHRPHRFFNGGNSPMAMIWVYAGDEPRRTEVEQGRCFG